ncbi:MAG: sialidase family protein [Nitrososphaeraceae archaeon]
MNSYIDNFNKIFKLEFALSISFVIFIFCSMSYVTNIFAFENSELNLVSSTMNKSINTTSFFNSKELDLTNLTNNTSDSIYSQIASFKNNIYVVWQESMPANLSELNYDIFFIKSEDNGKTFSSPINLSNNTYFSGRPQIMASENGIYVVWSDKISSSNKDISFIKSEDNGKTFSSPINLSNNSYISSNPDISAYDESVYIVWKDREQNSTQESIVFKYSKNMGKNFGESINLMNDTNNSFPKVNSYENHVYLIWNSENINGMNPVNDLYFIKSEDNGKTFNKIIKLGNNNFGESQIAVHKNKLLVASGGLIFANSTNFDLYIIESHDYGNSFTQPKKISEYLFESKNNMTKSNELDSMINNPLNVELSNKDLSYIVWQNTFSGNYQNILLLNKINDTDFQITNLTDNIEGISQCPSLAISNGYVHVIWESFINDNNEIIFTSIQLR